MCENCWDKYGHHIIDTPAIQAAAETIRRLYEVAAGGGRLHIVVDDWNLEDHHLDFCAGLIERDPDWRDPYFGDEDPEQRGLEQACLQALRSLTLAERGSALALAEGFWTMIVPQR